MVYLSPVNVCDDIDTRSIPDTHPRTYITDRNLRIVPVFLDDVDRCIWSKALVEHYPHELTGIESIEALVVGAHNPRPTVLSNGIDAYAELDALLADLLGHRQWGENQNPAMPRDVARPLQQNRRLAESGIREDRGTTPA
jgi:hypothetical protein